MKEKITITKEELKVAMCDVVSSLAAKEDSVFKGILITTIGVKINKELNKLLFGEESKTKMMKIKDITWELSTRICKSHENCNDCPLDCDCGCKDNYLKEYGEEEIDVSPYLKD